MKLDLKFNGEITKVKDGTVVPEDQWMCFLAKDNAFPETLMFYRNRCIELECDEEQVDAVNKAYERLINWRQDNRDKLKKPDAKGEKLNG